MKIQKTTPNNKKIIIIAIAIVLLLGAGGTAFAYFVKQNDATEQARKDKKSQDIDNTVDYETPTDEQVKAGNDAKEDFIKNQDNGNTQSPVNIEISSDSQSGTVYQVRTIITSSKTDGECKVTLSQNGKVSVTEQAGVQAYPSYVTCKGFDLDVSNLAAGKWKLTIEYSDSSGKKSVTKEITLV